MILAGVLVEQWFWGAWHSAERFTAGGGTLKTGRYVKYEKDTPLNNLFLSMAHRMGASLDSLGDSRGLLTGLD